MGVNVKLLCYSPKRDVNVSFVIEGQNSRQTVGLLSSMDFLMLVRREVESDSKGFELIGNNFLNNTEAAKKDFERVRNNVIGNNGRVLLLYPDDELMREIKRTRGIGVALSSVGPIIAKANSPLGEHSEPSTKSPNHHKPSTTVHSPSLEGSTIELTTRDGSDKCCRI